MHAESIYHDSRLGLLKIVWDDKLTQVFSSGFLRKACQCAICKANHINHPSPIIPESVSIIEIRPVGAYGIQLIFSDGHDRGIYPWVYLRGFGNPHL